MNEYIDTTLEEGEWGDEPEIVAFSELYVINVHVYDSMISSTHYLVDNNDTFTRTIYFLLTNNNHFDLLRVKGSSDSVKYRKVKKKEYKQKKQAVLKKNEKDHTIKREYSTIYTKKHL